MATSVATELTKIVPTVVEIEVEGLTPLICNNFSEKIKEQIRQAQAGKKKLQLPKNPAELFEGAKYLLPDGSYGFPAAGFKGACVSAGRFFNGVTMTALRQGIFVHGEGPDQVDHLLSRELAVHVRIDPGGDVVHADDVTVASKNL